MDTIATGVAMFLEDARQKSADGLTWEEFGELLVQLLHVAVPLADEMSLPGPQRKECVMDAVAALFDLTASRCVPLWTLPIWSLIRPHVRGLVLALASGAIEALLPVLRGSN